MCIEPIFFRYGFDNNRKTHDNGPKGLLSEIKNAKKENIFNGNSLNLLQREKSKPNFQVDY